MVASIFKVTESLQTAAIIHSIARHAVAHDKVLEAADVAFRVDARGNVVMVEPEKQVLLPQKKNISSDQEKQIIVPRQEAYERIASATRKKVEQLSRVSELMQKQTRRWSQFSWIMAIVATVGILLTAVAAVVLDISQKHILWLLLFISMNIGSMLVVGYLLWRAHQCQRQAGTYLDSFLEIENFSEMINIVAELAVDDATRGLLQEIIVAQSLGLQSRDVKIQDEDAMSYR